MLSVMCLSSLPEIDLLKLLRWFTVRFSAGQLEAVCPSENTAGMQHTSVQCARVY